MRVLCLTDFPVKSPDRWIWNYLPDQSDEVDFLWAETRDRFGGWGKLLTRYPPYFRLAWRAMAQISRQRYDVVVAWESKVGVPFALAKRWRCRRMPPFVLLAFNPGDLPAVAQPLIRAALRHVDHLTVLARAEADDYRQRYHVPSEKITLSPLPSYDVYHNASALTAASNLAGSPYIHASGRSSRDYATLVEAVSDLQVRTIIHGRGYNFKGLRIPPNVEIGELASPDDFHRLVYGATVEVVPLQPQLRPAGSSQVVFAMMMGKPVVVTANPSMTDFVEHGVTGLLVEPGNAQAMREAIVYLLEHPEEAARMGRAARQRFEQLHTFEQFARRTHQLLRWVAYGSGVTE